MKRIAEALVECGYAHRIIHISPIRVYRENTPNPVAQVVNPFADTLEGRRQADALEVWLMDQRAENNAIWNRSTMIINYPRIREKSEHQWRLARIKWCFEQLEGEK